VESSSHSAAAAAAEGSDLHCQAVAGMGCLLRGCQHALDQVLLLLLLLELAAAAAAVTVP
jgi:hypothetical protein